MNIQIPRLVAAAFGFLLLVALLAAFVYGVTVQRYRIFPFQHIVAVEEAISWAVDKVTGAVWYYRESEQPIPAPKFSDGFDQGQLYLLSLFETDERLMIRVIDAAGRIYNEWDIDWFRLWPDATHVPAADLPKQRPGTNIHGVEMLPGGDIVFNLEHLGLFRMSPCGEVVWKLPYQTHHSVFLDEDGNIWVSGKITHLEPLDDYPNHRPPFIESTILQVSPDGEILREISLYEMLSANDLRAFLHMSTIKNRQTTVSGDILHLNDVEVFPRSIPEGVFRHGDVMVSLRNINSVFVFDPDTLELRYSKTGSFTRQHDPDFLDGNTISVFDNNNVAPKESGPQSRILIVSALTGETSTWYQGNADHPFYTNIRGKHQWVQEDQVLIVDATNGRVIQVDADGRLIWEYYNAIAERVVGGVGDAQLLPDTMKAVYSEKQEQRCAAAAR